LCVGVGKHKTPVGAGDLRTTVSIQFISKFSRKVFGMQYDDFMSKKHLRAGVHGFEVQQAINPKLFDWQRDIVRWSLNIGKSAIFAERGLGKTAMELTWADEVAKHTGGKVLVLTPLAVAHQHIREGVKFGVDATYCRSQDAADNAPTSVIVANYEMLKEFSPDMFVGVVLDESSILKSFTGATKRMLLDVFEHTPYKLAATATPAPNDHLELGNHAEFLNIMPSNEMISRWFINNSMKAGDYRLKRHAEKKFWRWVTTWAVCLSKPSDLGEQYSDEGYILPPLHVHQEVVMVDHRRAFDNGRLIIDDNSSATQMWKEKAATAGDRCSRAAEIVRMDNNNPWIVWCDTNDEADLLQALLPEAVEVRGSDSVTEKERKLSAFSNGDARIIITKADIAGFGLNWQHCNNQVFAGVTHSFEKFYQALGRSYRFGQTKPVNAWVVFAESEGNIMDSIRTKQEAFKELQDQMSAAMRANGFSVGGNHSALSEVEEAIAAGEDYTLYLGDCVTSMRHIPDNSIGFSVFSPPFANLYIYSDSVADMGNCADYDEFQRHYDYLAAELMRVLMPGRLVAIHCKDLPKYMNRDGAAGLYDFPSDLRESMERAGFIYHSRVTIWKDPVTEMQRTKNHGLLHRNFSDRSEVVRQGMADYILVFRKWSDDMPDKQIQHNIGGPDSNTDGIEAHQYIGTQGPEYWRDDRDYSIQVWQRYASPVWFDINQQDVLNHRIAKTDQDEKHICPLQLDVIERCIWLWSNPGDTVLSPFTGIGSEGYVALKTRRKFIGIELKKSYWQMAQKHLEVALTDRNTMTLFDLALAAD